MIMKLFVRFGVKFSKFPRMNNKLAMIDDQSCQHLMANQHHVSGGFHLKCIVHLVIGFFLTNVTLNMIRTKKKMYLLRGIYLYMEMFNSIDSSIVIWEEGKRLL